MQTAWGSAYMRRSGRKVQASNGPARRKHLPPEMLERRARQSTASAVVLAMVQYVVSKHWSAQGGPRMLPVARDNLGVGILGSVGSVCGWVCGVGPQMIGVWSVTEGHVVRSVRQLCGWDIWLTAACLSQTCKVLAVSGLGFPMSLNQIAMCWHNCSFHTQSILSQCSFNCLWQLHQLCSAALVASETTADLLAKPCLSQISLLVLQCSSFCSPEHCFVRVTLPLRSLPIMWCSLFCFWSHSWHCTAAFSAFQTIDNHVGKLLLHLPPVLYASCKALVNTDIVSACD